MEDTFYEALKAAFMAGFEASTARLNGDTPINGCHDKTALVMEYLGLEQQFQAWYNSGLCK